MADQTRPRPTRTRKPSGPPDPMPFIEALSEGHYDDKIGLIAGALNDRRRALQDRVLAEVKEVFGEDYIVTKPTANSVPAVAPVQAPATAAPQPQPGAATRTAPAHPAQPSPALSAEDRAIRDSDAPTGDGLGQSAREATMEIESRGAQFGVPLGGLDGGGMVGIG